MALLDLLDPLYFNKKKTINQQDPLTQWQWQGDAFGEVDPSKSAGLIGGEFARQAQSAPQAGAAGGSAGIDWKTLIPQLLQITGATITDANSGGRTNRLDGVNENIAAHRNFMKQLEARQLLAQYVGGAGRSGGQSGGAGTAQGQGRWQPDRDIEAQLLSNPYTSMSDIKAARELGAGPAGPEFDTDVQFTKDGRAYLAGKDGSIKWLDGVTPRDAIKIDAGSGRAYNEFDTPPGTVFEDPDWTTSRISANASAANARTAQDRLAWDRDQPVVVNPGAQLVSRGSGEPIYTAPKKPLPATLQKEETGDIEAIGLAKSISQDLGAISQQIATGKLDLGLFANMASGARNWAGISDEGSRNFASFNSTLEKMRNDSLRLNKGVQTEGDAVRAWNELMTNINDPKLVMERIAEINAINERAADLRAQRIDMRRQNYGLDPFDASQIAPPSAIGVAPPGGTAGQTNDPADPLGIRRRR